jgi:hypothetical protein
MPRTRPAFATAAVDHLRRSAAACAPSSTASARRRCASSRSATPTPRCRDRSSISSSPARPPRRSSAACAPCSAATRSRAPSRCSPPAPSSCAAPASRAPRPSPCRTSRASAVGGEIPSFRSLARMDDDAIIERLTQVRGIGRWSVEMLLIFRMGRPDVWPTGDYAVRKSYAASCTASPELPTPSAPSTTAASPGARTAAPPPGTCGGPSTPRPAVWRPGEPDCLVHLDRQQRPRGRSARSTRSDAEGGGPLHRAPDRAAARRAPRSTSPATSRSPTAPAA